MTLSPKENLLAALHHAGPEWVPYDGECSWQFLDMEGRGTPPQGVDAWGLAWLPLPDAYSAGPDEPLQAYPGAPVATSVRALLACPFPNASAGSLYAHLAGSFDPGQVLAIGRHPAGPLDRLTALLGMERALADLLADPDASLAALERIADYHVQVAQGYLAAGAEAGWLADDYAGQGGPLLRPALWRRLVLPGLARIIAVYRAAGRPVFFHTCGRAEAFVSDLLDAGVTAFNLESSVCNLAALKAQFGTRIAFFGGLSVATMLNGSPEDVGRATRATIQDLGAGGGLVLASDQPLNFPEANLAAFHEAARQFGSYWN